MLQAIAELIDFDPAVFDDHQIIEDFVHKFANSWVNIDGTFFRVLSLYQDDDDNHIIKASSIEGDNHYLKVDKIRKITKHMPPTGLYKSKYGLLYLSRIPARQWLKSYAEGKNYKVSVLCLPKDNNGQANTRNTVLNPEAEYHRETMVDDFNQVWLHWKMVGTLDTRKHCITLNSDIFLKEIQELWPQYQIISAANPQPVRLDERLITDF